MELVKPGKSLKVLCTTPVYIAEDENQNLVVDRKYFNLGLLVNTDRIKEKNIILSKKDKIRVRKFLDETNMNYSRAPQVKAIHFMGYYAEEIKKDILNGNSEAIHHFDEFIALLHPAESFDHYVFMR
jgi:hypothetical protein